MHPLVTDTAPWWGEPLNTALTLAAGSGLTVVGAWLRGRSDQTLVDKRRWDDLILETALEVDLICTKMAGLGHPGGEYFIEAPTPRSMRYRELRDELSEAQARYRLVASDELIKATDTFKGAAENWAFRDSYAGTLHPEGFEQARQGFSDVVRAEIRANKLKQPRPPRERRRGSRSR